MATNKKISELEEAATLTGNEQVELLQVGANVRTSLTTIKNWLATFFATITALAEKMVLVPTATEDNIATYDVSGQVKDSTVPVSIITELNDRVDNLESLTSSLILYLDNSASDIATYEQLLRTPTGMTLAEETIAINNNTVIIDNYATIAGFPGSTTIPAGVWTTHGHFQFSAVTGNNYIHWDVYKRTSGGTETLLFRMSSPAVTVTTEQEILIQAVQSEIILAVGDRLVTKLYAQTTGAAKNCTFRYNSADKFAFIQPPAFSIALNHDSMLLVNDAGAGVEKGHVTAGAQDIYGKKTFVGTSAIDGSAPVMIQVKDLQTSSGWTIGAEICGYEFYSSDATVGVGPSVRGKIVLVTDTEIGEKNGLNFYTHNGVNLILALQLDSAGKLIIPVTPTVEATVANPPLTRNGTTGAIELGGKKVTTIASSATPTPTGWAFENELILTALAEDATIAAPDGTPVDGNKLIIIILDNGVARELIFNSIYRAIGITIPIITIVNKAMYLFARYNGNASKWDVYDVKQQA